MLTFLRARGTIELHPVDRRGYYRSPATMPGYRKGLEPATKGRRFPPEPLTPREVLAIIDACGKGYAGLRNRALIVLLWRAGLRVSEALALYPKDVDLDLGRVQVLHGKGDKDRAPWIDPAAAAIIANWMRARAKLGLGPRQPVFCVISRPTLGQPLHATYVRNMVKAAGLRAGIDKRVHPHGFRHTHAFELAGERTDLRLIKAQLGHSDLSTTARYIEHLHSAELADAIRNRSWPGSPAQPGATSPENGAA